MNAPLLHASFAAALLFTTSICAQDKVRLTVRVVDAESGRPVEGYRTVTFDSPAVAGRADGAPDGQGTGDAQGVVVAEFKTGDANGYRRRLQIWHPDFVSVEKSWMYFPRSPSPRLEFPEEFTVKLERGVTIGGVVKDDAGHPLAGVQVIPLRHGYGQNAPPDSWPAWPDNYTAERATHSVHATTDAAGRWQMGQFPSAVNDVAFVFVRPDRSFVTIYTSTQRDPYSQFSGPVVPLSEFRARQAEVVLPPGQTVKGIVVRPDGKPLAGVTLSETHGRTPGIVARTVTGSNGRFTLPNRPAKEIVLRARAAGYALVATNVVVEPGLPELRLMLQPQRGIAGRVENGEGKPLVGARVALNAFGFLTPLEWDGTNTDAEGRFRWDAGPFEPTELYIVVTNGPTRKVTLRAGEPERVIVIRPEHAEFIRLTGTVVAADTKEPVKQFAVTSSGSDTYSFDFKADGSDGRIDLKLPLTAWRENHLPVGELQVVAAGFKPQPIGRVELREGDREFHVELKRGVSQMAGVVLQPDGQPAEGAKMELTRGFSSTFLYRAGEFQPPQRDAERFTTGADGKYSFPADHRNKSLVVAHSSGFTAVWPSNLLEAVSIQLQPWARVSGVAMESGRPLGNQSVTLRSPSGAWTAEGFAVGYGTTTDAEGRFSFERVPAGRYLLSRRLPVPPSRSGQMSIQYSHAQGLVVLAGESKEVTYGGKGRTITGLAQTDPPGLAVDWQWDINHLVPVPQSGKPAQPNLYDYASQETYTAALRRFQAGGKGGDSLASEARYQIQFESDGHFQITDVPPGKYELAINLTEPQQGRQAFSFPGSGKSLGTGRQTLVIPEGPVDQPVDMGTILVKVSANLARAKPLPPFEALTLDGKPLRVAELRGKHVLLVFWAAWCRASAEALPELEKVFAAHGGNPRLAMIGLSLDESPEVARAFADKRGLKWATAWLDEAGRLRLLDTYGVRGTPTILLLDPAGKIIARDVKLATLGATLGTALGPAQTPVRPR